MVATSWLVLSGWATLVFDDLPSIERCHGCHGCTVSDDTTYVVLCLIVVALRAVFVEK